MKILEDGPAGTPRPPTHARGLFRCAVAALIVTVSACSDDGPTAIGPPAFSTGTAAVLSISDGSTEARIDPVTAQLSVRNLATGYVVYAVLEPDMLETMIELMRAAGIGDQNAALLAELNPYEYAPEDPPLDFDSTHMAVYSEQYFLYGTPTVSEPVASSPPPLLMRVMATQPPKRRGRAATTYYPSTTFTTLSEGGDCAAYAAEIGQKRLDYHHSRAGSMSHLNMLVGIPTTSLKWEDGNPFIRLENLRTFFVTAGADFAESRMRGLQLDIMRVVYNSYYCQQAIVIQLPTGQVLVGSPTTTTSSGSYGGNSGGLSCTTYIEMWEISYDGGRTWWPFPIERALCVRME